MRHSITTGHASLEQWTVAAGVSILAAAIAAPASAHVHTAAGIVVAGACLAATPVVAARVPASLRGAGRHRPMASAIWVLVALFAIVQMGRLSAFMADPSRTWGSTVPDPAATSHQCLSAYVYAAELSRRGERNIYDAHWWIAVMGAPPLPDTIDVLVGIASQGLVIALNGRVLLKTPQPLNTAAALVEIAATRRLLPIRAEW